VAVKSGTRLGPYEILAPIGAGGMGEVYRARDTRLKRDVAVKILPETFVNNSDRIVRFQREAEVLASLNHPNVTSDEKRFLVVTTGLVGSSSPPLPVVVNWKAGR
jgi:serine/threonine protein kinase